MDLPGLPSCAAWEAARPPWTTSPSVTPPACRHGSGVCSTTRSSASWRTTGCQSSTSKRVACCEYTALVRTLSGERQAKLRSLLELYIHLGSQGGLVPRLELASVIDKLQFCRLAVQPGQAHMRALYVARDSYGPSVEASASWLPDVVCQLNTEALEALRWWHSRMVSGGRPGGYSGARRPVAVYGEPTVLQHLPGDGQVEQLDGHIAVITTDASGWAGGAWWGQRRLQYAFTDAQLAGLYGGSANLRELYVPPFTVEKWQCRGVRILFRMDSRQWSLSIAGALWCPTSTPWCYS